MADFFSHCEANGNPCDEQQLQELGLSPHIKQDLRVTVVEELVNNSGIFEGCSSAFVRDVMLELVQEQHSKKSFIINSTVAPGVYFIKSGKVT